ncbi:hypothetical protein IEQ34_008827 [Dendrobium chrysotoxum]|uniref:Uncharacterized protein n=1 Tax=Dendrobium chrysotoxum TaxID=161865 RepID=A0AAV7H0D3_DENCH|nr:hypothetical protein IEQ34_008827 [Dendrobium chrysotoxum]
MQLGRVYGLGSQAYAYEGRISSGNSINVEITFQSDEGFFSAIGFWRIILRYMCRKYDMTKFLAEYATELLTDRSTTFSIGNSGALFVGTRQQKRLRVVKHIHQLSVGTSAGMGATSDLPPMLELAADATLTPPVSSIQNEEKKSEIKSTIEKGSSNSRTLFGTKSARKNYLRRPEAAEELPVPTSSPLLKGSHFDPLAATAGEERVARIASSPPSPVDYSVKRPTKEKYTLRKNHKEKGVISYKLEKEVLKEERSEARNLTPQLVRRNKKLVEQPITSVLEDGYHWVPHLPSVKIEEIVLTGSGRGCSLSSRPPVLPSGLSKLAPVIDKLKEILKDLQPVDVKGKRPMISVEPYASMKLSRSLGIQIRDSA